MTTKLEAGGREQFTLTTSVALDENPLFFMKDSSGTLVYSSTGASSGDGYYYEYADVPSSSGMFTYHWHYAINTNSFIESARFESVQTLAIETSGLYCDANDVINLYGSLRDSKIRNEEIDEFIRDVMNEVNAKVGHRYGVPFATAVNSFPPVIGTITKNLTLVSLMERKGGAELPGWIERRDERYRGMLDEIAEGNIFLTLSGGIVLAPAMSAQAGQVDHSHESYRPTFNMLEWEDQKVDPDLREDTEDDLN